MKRQRGITRIELMIVGVLATIAIPACREYVERTQRTDAMIALTRIAARQPRAKRRRTRD